MKTKLLFLMMTLLGITVGAQAENLAINAMNFPDENFRAYISSNCDPNEDGILTDAEIAEVTVVDVPSQDISSLKGIELFTALRKLYCDNNQLTTLDLSKNTALEKLDCGYNQLKRLDISKNTALIYLYCYYNQLTALDLSKNTALEFLGCNDNQLTALDISKNPQLSWVECFRNRIRGDAMQTLVNGMYDRSATWSGSLYVYNMESADGNEMTTSQAAAAKAKNWQVLMYNGSDWVDYSGGSSGESTASITLNKKEVIVKKNKTVTLKATVSPETLTDKSVTWKSSDKTIATVSSSGTVKGVKTGTATITCTSVATGAKATCKVIVGTITLDQTNVVVKKNKTVTLTPTVYPTTLADKSVIWESSDESIATVTSGGKVKGVKTGIATITCTSVATGLSTTCTVTVGTITLDQTNVVVKKNKTVTLTPTVYPLTLEDKSVKWKSSDKTIATVSSSGKVKGVKTGTVTITCTSVATGLSTTCTVTVGTITLDQTNVVVKKNKTVKLTPTVYPTTLADKSVTWKSSDKTIASVTSTGTVKGLKTGTVTITCTSVATGLSATCTVIVGTITLNKSEVTINQRDKITLKPTVYPTTLEDKSVTWKSSDETTATVTSDGIVEGIKAGTVTITCTSVATGLSTTCKVTVKASASARTLDEEGADVTGIETIDENPAIKEPVDVYDLGGRQVLQRATSLDGLPAGVYIVNGKKMLKK